MGSAHAARRPGREIGSKERSGACMSGPKRSLGPPEAPAARLLESLDLLVEPFNLVVLEAGVGVPDDAGLVDDEARRHGHIGEAIGVGSLVILVADDRELRLVLLGEGVKVLLLLRFGIVDRDREDNHAAP